MDYKVPVKNEQGAVVGELALDPAVFGVVPKPALVHEAYEAQRAGARHPVAHTKTRAEVRGGGKKPWKQKGTGRARHGSTRSPIWVGGGVTFGPRPSRNYHTRLPKKIRAAAIRMSFSDHAATGTLTVLDTLAFPEFKTKRMATILSALGFSGKKLLLVLPAPDLRTAKSAMNIARLTVRNVGNISVVDLVDNPVILTSTAGVERITATWKPKK